MEDSKIHENNNNDNVNIQQTTPTPTPDTNVEQQQQQQQPNEGSTKNEKETNIEQPITTTIQTPQPLPPTIATDLKPPVLVVDRKCLSHSDRMCDAYCKDCYLVICEQCTKESHKQHQTIDKLNVEELCALLPTVSNFTENTTVLKDERQHLSKMLQQLEDNFKSCRSSIVEQFKDLQFLIKQREMKLEKEIQTEYEQSKAELIKRMSQLDRELTQADPLLEPSKSYQTANPQELFDNKRFEFLDNYSHIKQIPRIEHDPPVDLTIQFDLKVDIDKRSMITKEVQSLGLITSTKKSTVPPASTSTTPSASSPTVAAPSTSAPPAAKTLRDNRLNITNHFSANEGFKYFYSIGGWNENGSDLSSIYKYDVDKNEWRFISSKGLSTTDGVPFVSSSCITDGKYIYVFGGNYTITTYRRFNLAKQQWDKSLEKLNRGGGGIAAQYDGKKYVYLFGGKVLEETKQYHQIVHRIERMNTSTKQIEHLNNLTRHKYTIYPCFDPLNGYIYLVGGQVVNGRACKEIEVYDTVENVCTVYSSLGAGGLVQGAIIDGRYESIYYITSTHFKRFTLATKKFETLEFPPLTNTTCRPTLIYDSKTRIYLFDQNDNYAYDIPTGKWSKFTYTRKVALCGQGMVGSMI
ncbi:hypothetical protein PPL_06473 [Heterostelium album PN500]|uniref:B box-type domain-containing protein n=1 Tax=Heterostelium pallidum (strain ATCC 26659 / Pp 5 / PN500) TaxID=670386 RepID=D3BD92_HETP5|nr:hypothetical protein PPL_06473 [Heterostelium album PN500]EFA80884.1 hypothetical protein PPL_06473 [Heterostelium album PN500]|eukprot:XP_020433003.1 hypothetical protein PPL_06473 [Heterostelium album PN500]